MSSRSLDYDASGAERAKRVKREGGGGGCCWQNDIPEHLLLLVFETMQSREDGVELVCLSGKLGGVPRVTCWTELEWSGVC